MGRAGFFQTSNSKVEGFFCGYEYAVQTSNAPIDATALMFGESAGSESQVQLKTSNGWVSSSHVLNIRPRVTYLPSQRNQRQPRHHIRLREQYPPGSRRDLKRASHPSDAVNGT